MCPQRPSTSRFHNMNQETCRRGPKRKPDRRLLQHWSADARPTPHPPRQRTIGTVTGSSSGPSIVWFCLTQTLRRDQKSFLLKTWQPSFLCSCLGRARTPLWGSECVSKSVTITVGQQLFFFFFALIQFKTFYFVILGNVRISKVDLFFHIAVSVPHHITHERQHRK